MTTQTRTSSAAKQGWLLIGRIALSIFGSLFCVVALKFMFEHKLAPRNSGLAGVLALSKVDLLLIGSSHTRRSYDMRELEKETGVHDSFLVSYDGIDLTAISEMLDYLTTKRKQFPRYVVVEAYSVMLATRPHIQDPRLFIEAPPPLKMIITGSYLSNHHYSLSSFQDVFDLFVNRGNDEILAYPLYAWAARAGSYKGGRTDLYFPDLNAQAFRKLRVPISTSDPDPDQLRAFNHIIDLSRSHNIALIFIDTPMPRPVTANPHIQALKRHFSTIIGSRRYPYIDGDNGFPTNSPLMFGDSNHLSSDGRRLFTLIISEKIACWMASRSSTSNVTKCRPNERSAAFRVRQDLGQPSSQAMSKI